MLESWFNGDGNRDGNSVRRQPEEQAIVDVATQKLALYFYETCWFSGKVRSTIERLALNIELRDIHKDRAHYERLVNEGGRQTVPCLRIEHEDGSAEWMYESADISAYLERRFDGSAEIRPEP